MRLTVVFWLVSLIISDYHLFKVYNKLPIYLVQYDTVKVFVYRDCVCVILLWIMTPKVDDSFKANLWINCKKDNQCVLSWKKWGQMTVQRYEISLTVERHYPKGEGPNPRNSWRRYVFCLICGSTTMLLKMFRE